MQRVFIDLVGTLLMDGILVRVDMCFFLTFCFVLFHLASVLIDKVYS